MTRDCDCPEHEDCPLGTGLNILLGIARADKTHTPCLVFLMEEAEAAAEALSPTTPGFLPAMHALRLAGAEQGIGALGVGAVITAASWDDAQPTLGPQRGSAQRSKTPPLDLMVAAAAEMSHPVPWLHTLAEMLPYSTTRVSTSRHASLSTPALDMLLTAARDQATSVPVLMTLAECRGWTPLEEQPSAGSDTVQCVEESKPHGGRATHYADCTQTPIPAPVDTSAVGSAEHKSREGMAVKEYKGRRTEMLRMAVLANRERLERMSQQQGIPAMICKWRPPPADALRRIRRLPDWASSPEASEWLRSAGIPLPTA